MDDIEAGSIHPGGRESMETNLIRYDAACRAIQAAATVDEAKDIKDQATALAV